MCRFRACLLNHAGVKTTCLMSTVNGSSSTTYSYLDNDCSATEASCLANDLVNVATSSDQSFSYFAAQGGVYFIVVDSTFSTTGTQNLEWKVCLRVWPVRHTTFQCLDGMSLSGCNADGITVCRHRDMSCWMYVSISCHAKVTHDICATARHRRRWHIHRRRCHRADVNDCPLLIQCMYSVDQHNSQVMITSVKLWISLRKRGPGRQGLRLLRCVRSSIVIYIVTDCSAPDASHVVAGDSRLLHAVDGFLRMIQRMYGIRLAYELLRPSTVGRRLDVGFQR